MRILQVGKFYPVRGGVEKVMYDLMVGLSRRNIHCDMLCAVTERQKPGTIQLNEYARLFCMATWLKLSATMISPALILKLRKIRREYDIIHIHHPDPMACLALFLSGYKGKVILHWHSDILKQKMLLRLYRPLQRWLIRRANVIVGTTPVYVQQSPFLKHAQAKITDIPIGIDELHAESDKIARIKALYAGKTIVFSLGRLVEYKGFAFLIEAATYLADKYVILIGGEGHLRNKLQQQIDELGVGEKVKLLGFIPDDKDAAAYFMACDVFCMSSIWKTEAFGIVQIEAMSCGKPVVATCIEGSGVSWVNAHGISGYNVASQDAKALAEAIETIVSDSNHYEKLSTGARRRFETMFTTDTMVDKCLKLYHTLIGKTISIPNDLFFKEVNILLQEGKQVRIPVKGRSMRPFLLDGDTALLTPASKQSVRWGDIVLARTTTGRIVLHRVVFRKKQNLWLMGDAHSRQKERTTESNVLAITAIVIRKGKELKLVSFGRRCTGMIWFLMIPFREYIVRLYDKLNRKTKYED